jgi:hypothetical protein
MDTRKSIYNLSCGEMGKIVGFMDLQTESLSIGMGLCIGKDIKCVFESGTIVITANNRSIAIGKEIAKKIYVL